VPPRPPSTIVRSYKQVRILYNFIPHLWATILMSNCYEIEGNVALGGSLSEINCVVFVHTLVQQLGLELCFLPCKCLPVPPYLLAGYRDGVSMCKWNHKTRNCRRCVRLTTLPPSHAVCLEIWEPQPAGTLCGRSRGL